MDALRTPDERFASLPDFDFTPDAAPPIQSDGSVIVTPTVPVRDAAALAGAEPERISRIGVVPAIVSIASSIALRSSVENCRAIITSPGGLAFEMLLRCFGPTPAPYPACVQSSS